MSFRIPPTSKYAQIAAAGIATGTWDRRENSFVFLFPPGTPKGYMKFTGISYNYKFEFDTTQCSGSYVSWGD